MRRIYISFLGAGKYDSAVYHINGQKADPSPYVQFAELQLAGPGFFDQIFLVMTSTSRKKHYLSLQQELSKIGINDVREIDITEELNPEDQWSWFEEILSHIDHGDELYVDMTHGYRIIPIVFSTALNFLQKAKSVRLKAVYYGAYESNKELSPIIDMKDFYVINEWTDAVSRLVEDADPGKLAVVAENEAAGKLDEFNDPELICAFQDLTGALKNVDIHNVSQKASRALDIVRQKENDAGVTGKILFDLVKEKFVSLVFEKTFSGRYDLDYFKIQLEIVRLLLEHKLFMQAYTVMREMLGSFGLIRMKENMGITNKERRDQRQKADVFINMLQVNENEWNFRGERLAHHQTILPLFRAMAEKKIIIKMKEIAQDLIAYRNGFDHAWTSKKEAKTDIMKKGEAFFKSLQAIVQALNQEGFLMQPEP